jgi:hypothetical protein
MLLVVSFLFCLSLAACGGGEPPEPTLTPLQIELQESIQAWEAHGIDSYTMQVTFRKAGWHPQIMNIRVEAGAAEIEDQTCMPERTCYERPLEAADYSIDAILALIAEQLAVNGVSQAVFHEEYSFPRITKTLVGEFEISDFKPLDE